MPYLRTKNAIVYYQWFDNNKTNSIVLINSLGATSSIWSEVIVPLGKNWNILLHDKRGHGQSPSSEQPCTIDDYADDIIALMNHCDIPQSHILGLSIGGLITFSLASRYPKRCDRLIFCCTGAKIGTEQTWSERISNIQREGLPSMAEDIILRWLSKEFTSKHPAESEGNTYMLKTANQQGYIDACMAIKQADYVEEAKKIEHASLFISGSEDIGTPPDFVYDQSQLVRNADYQLIKGAAHLPCIDSPEKLINIINSFLT